MTNSLTYFATGVVRQVGRWHNHEMKGDGLSLNVSAYPRPLSQSFGDLPGSECQIRTAKFLMVPTDQKIARHRKI